MIAAIAAVLAVSAGIRATAAAQPEPFDVRAFGARGDGAHDDTAALARAIDAASKAGAGRNTGAIVSLQAGTYRVSSTVVVPAGVIVRGAGRIASTLLADARFPARTPIVVLGGNRETLTFGARLENLKIDCNGVTDSIGVESTKVNEQSGLNGVLVENWKAKGIYIHNSAAQNYMLDNLEVIAHAAVDSQAIGVDIDCGGSYFREIAHFTINGNGNYFRAGIRLDNCVGGRVSTGNIEKVVDGVLVGNIIGNTGIFVENINGHSVRNTVAIPKLESAALTFVNVLKRGTTVNAIYDGINNATSTETAVPLYIVGTRIKTALKFSNGGVGVGVPTPAASIDVRTSAGHCYLKASDGSAASAQHCFQHAQTTDDVLTRVLTVPLSDHAVYVVTVRVAARRLNGTGADGAVLSGVFLRDRGDAQQLGTTATTLGPATYRIELVARGSELTVEVAGRRDHSVSWSIDADVVLAGT